MLDIKEDDVADAIKIFEEITNNNNSDISIQYLSSNSWNVEVLLIFTFLESCAAIS